MPADQTKVTRDRAAGSASGASVQRAMAETMQRMFALKDSFIKIAETT